MKKATLRKAGLAATILLAPGGFILGAVLISRYYRTRAGSGAHAAKDEAQDENQ